MAPKRVFILIGPKGCGKTFIGALLQERLGIPFLRVEDIALQVNRSRAVDDATYIDEVFAAIETSVRQQLAGADELVFESTGLTSAFDNMLARLQRDYRVALIRIRAAPDRCLTRVRSRDQAIHVAVSDEQIRAINALSVEKTFTFSGEIDNNDAAAEAILDAFARIRQQVG